MQLVRYNKIYGGGYKEHTDYSWTVFCINTYKLQTVGILGALHYWLVFRKVHATYYLQIQEKKA